MGRSKKPLPKAKDGVGDLGQFRNLCAVSICVIAVGIVVMALPDASPKPTPSANASGTELSMYDPNRTGCENVFRLTDVFQLTHMLRLTHGSKRRVTEGEFQQAMANATRLLAEGQCVLIKDTWKAQYHWASFIKNYLAIQAHLYPFSRRYVPDRPLTELLSSVVVAGGSWLQPKLSTNVSVQLLNETYGVIPKDLHLTEKHLYDLCNKLHDYGLMHQAVAYKDLPLLQWAIKQRQFPPVSPRFVFEGRVAMRSTPMHYAVSNREDVSLIARRLLSQDASMLTALLEMAKLAPQMQGAVATLQELFHTEPSTSQGFPQTAIEAAALAWGNLLLAQLIQHGPPEYIQAPDGLGRTPLHLAVIARNVEAARMLLEAGGDPESWDLWTLSPLDWAAKYPCQGMAELFEGHYQGLGRAMPPLVGMEGPPRDIGEMTTRASPSAPWRLRQPYTGPPSWNTTRLESFAGNVSRCDIQEYPAGQPINPVTFLFDHYLAGRPAIIREGALDWRFRKSWRRAKLLRLLGAVKLTVGTIPYSQQFGAPTRNMSFAQYVEGMSSEEGLYIFGNLDFFSADPRVSPPLAPLAGDFPWLLPALAELHGNEGVSYKVHEAQFFLGPAGSGAPMHFHADAFNALAYGSKRWFISPPGGPHTTFSRQHPREWLRAREALPQAAPNQADGIQECTQNEGDIIYLPRDWAHQTLNIQESVGVAVEFNGRMTMMSDKME